MSDVATVEPARAPAAPRTGKRERISPKIAKAVNLLISGECKTQKAAAARVGVSDPYLCTQLKKPAVRAFYERRAHETIAQGQMRASARLVELLDASSEHVSLDAAKHTLALNGIKPADEPTIVNNINVMSGYVIDLATAPPVIEGTKNETD